jgi:hypothetical protein
MAIARANQEGVRPRDVEPALVAGSLIVADGTPPNVEDRLYAYYAALDRQDTETAGALIRLMGAGGAPPSRWVRSALAAESAYFLARYRREPAAAREVLRRFRGAAHEPEPFVRAAAAIFLAEGRRSAARAVLQQLREAVTRRRSKTGLDRFLYDDWASMLAEASAPPTGRSWDVEPR